MYVVGTVRCFGCPAFPYPKVGIFDALRTDPSRAIDFEMAVIERRLPGREIDGGWGWPELSSVDEAAGGATRAEVDAFRLLAVFLNNWDAKPVNQRLLCEEAGPGTRRMRPSPWRTCRTSGRPSAPRASISTAGRARRSGRIRRPAG